MGSFRKRLRVVPLAGVILVVAGLVLTGCGSSSSDTGTTTQDTPKPGGVYNYPLHSNPVSIEPLNAQETEGAQVAHQVFEGLVKYVMNDKGEMVAEPAIAESWDTTDSTTWTFKLKKGVTFQAPVNREVVAQDFVDSWDRVTDPKNQSYVSYILAPIVGCDDGGYQVDPKKGLTGVKAIDDYTLEVKLRYAFAEFPQTLGHTVAAATPVEYITKTGDKKFGQKPVGTGPYAVDSWKNNQSVTLVKNPTYWDTANAGYVDTINMPIILEQSTEWLQFQKGAIDYTEVPPGQVKVAETNPKVTSGEWTAKAYPNLGIYYIGMNLTDKALGGDLELRKAIYQATDAQNAINIVREGVPLPATGFVPEGVPGYVAGQSPYSFDPEAAKTAIAGMGDLPAFKYWYNTDEGHQKIAEVLQAGWKAAGIETKLSNYEWGTFLDKLSKSSGGTGDRSQLFRMGWVADYPSMDNFLYPLFQSDQSRYGSYTFYKNEQVDDLIQQARATVDDQQRHALYAQAEKIIVTDIPGVPLYYYRDFRVTNNRIGGFHQNPMYFVDMWKVWVK
jgi:peptide/nickel transport system substrate-binding protein/oligopeptide transport system substrate-binding protein